MFFADDRAEQSIDICGTATVNDVRTDEEVGVGGILGKTDGRRWRMGEAGDAGLGEGS